jgi:Type III restriction enzyme, res subunit
MSSIAIRNLEASLAQNKPQALIQMATGSGKTFTAFGFIYRLIKFAGARRVLFLVDRANLGRQAKKEFDAYVSPYNNYKFGEEFIVQHLQGNNLDTTARVTDTAAKWPVHHRCRLANACAAVKEPPEPTAMSGDRPAVRTAWRSVVMSHEIAHENACASLDISVP